VFLLLKVTNLKTIDNPVDNQQKPEEPLPPTFFSVPKTTYTEGKFMN